MKDMIYQCETWFLPMTNPHKECAEIKQLALRCKIEDGVLYIRSANIWPRDEGLKIKVYDPEINDFK